MSEAQGYIELMKGLAGDFIYQVILMSASALLLWGIIKLFSRRNK